MRSLPLLLAFLMISSLSLHARTWTNGKGKKIKAEFVEIEDGKVTIRLDKNGKEFSIAVKSLSLEDQAFLKEQEKKMAAPGNKTSGGKAKSPKRRSWRAAKAVKPNYDDPWPDKVEVDGLPEIIEVEKNKEKKRYVYHSPHYEFICDVQLTTSIVREFSKMFEATYRVMQELPMSFDRARDAEPGQRLKVLLFETRESYIANGGPPQSGGVYMTKNNLIMIPLKSLGVRKSGSRYSKKSGTENQTLAHELVHQLQDRVYDKKGALGWFTEGLAEYVSTSPYTTTGSGGRFTFKGNLRDIAKSVMEYDYDARAGSGLGKEITVQDLKKYMLQSYSSFTANGRFNYAVGMLLTAYFIHIDDDGSRKNLNAFLKAMREGKEGDEILNTLLAGRSWEELGEEVSKGWRKYGMKLTIN